MVTAPGAQACWGYLDQLGTSVTSPKSLRERQWLDEFSWHLEREMRPIAQRLDLAVIEHVDQATGEVRILESEWHRARARTIRIPAAERLELCGQRYRGVRCGCRTLVVRVGCGARWCESCQRDRFRPLRRRLKRAMDMHERAKNRARAQPRRWRWNLVTLTVAHSGDLVADRKIIVSGWRKLRQWLWGRIGAFPFALAWECTAGADGRGHLHAHVVALWPWVDWAAVHREWVRATGGRSNHISIEAMRKGANGGAKYLGKYATKGVVVGDLPPHIAAHFVRASYNQRTVYASEQFWRPIEAACSCCGEPWVETDRPEALIGYRIRQLCRSVHRQTRLPWGLGP